jgi:hypothetical protein
MVAPSARGCNFDSLRLSCLRCLQRAGGWGNAYMPMAYGLDYCRIRAPRMATDGN